VQLTIRIGGRREYLDVDSRLLLRATKREDAARRTTECVGRSEVRAGVEDAQRQPAI
jgi:hypothetical protein